MSATRTNEKLWQNIKNEYMRSNKYGVGWNARKAQAAVREYKLRGGKYLNNKRSRSRSRTSLHKWTKENWGYIGKEGKSRYLPEKVAKSLTSAEVRAENRRKGSRKGVRVPYSPSVRKKMRSKGIY